MHRLTDIDIENRTANCSICGHTKIQSKGWRGSRQRWRCTTHASTARYARRLNEAKLEGVQKNTNWYKYGRYKGEKCERPDCPYGADHRCLLDVHHIDGDRDNNAPDNLMTLCAFCHRLVTFGKLEL